MLYIGKRGYDILTIMIEENSFITSSELSVRIGTTTRTIKQDIKELNQFLVKYNSKIEGKQGVGYKLICTNFIQLKEIQMQLKHNQVVKYNNIPRSSLERQDYIFKKLLLIDFYITIEELSEELYVSKATIAKDIIYIKSLLKEYSLVIKSKPNKGVSLIGSEIEKRKCIFDYFFMGDENISHLIDKNTMFASNNSKKQLKEIREQIITFLKVYKILMPEASIENLSVNLYILIRRVQLYNFVKVDEDSIIKYKKYSEYKMAIDLANFIETSFNLLLDEDEVIYITMLIRSKSTKITYYENCEMANEILVEILCEIENKYAIKFDNINLIEMLKIHLACLIERLSINLQIRNKSNKHKFEYYPLATDIVDITCKCIYEKYNYKTETDERNFLLSYFTTLLIDYYSNQKIVVGIIAGNSRAEGCLLNNLLQQSNMFKFLEIIELNAFDLDDKKKISLIDVVLTTINVENSFLSKKLYLVDPYDLNSIDVVAKEIHKIKQINAITHADVY